MSEKKKKPNFGSMSVCKVKYVICVLFPSKGKYKFVNDVQFSPHKECRWEDGAKAMFFEDKVYAEDLVLGLNVNGTSCFVMEVPDWFNEDDFVNPEV